MKFSKPVTTLVCLLTGTSVFAAEAAKVVAPIAQAAAKNPAPKPLPTTLKISAINGVKNPNHNKTILRNPDQKISFSADLFVTQKGKLVPQNASARDFIWELDNRPACDSARPASCADAGIELTQDGISFTLPEDFENMKLKVSLATDAKKSDKISISNKVIAEQRAAEEREQAEMARQQAAEEQAAQEERNRQVLGTIFGAVVGGLSAYGEYKAQEQREERHEEMRRQWMQRNNPPQTPVVTPAPQPQPPVVTPAPAPVVAPAPTPAPAPQPQQPSGPRPDGGHGGAGAGGGFQGHGGAHGAH